MKNNSTQDPASILAQLSSQTAGNKQEVIYGVYDSFRQSLSTRFNDFLIDHARVPLQEKAYFFQLLAVMVDAGIPVIKAVKMLSLRTSNERFHRVLNTIAYSVSQGKTLSESMARFPDVFGELEIGVVRAGEAAGNLDKMLLRLAEQLNKSNELQIKLTTAAIYPVAVLVVLIAVSIGVLIWVIPSLVNLLKEAGLPEKDFPLLTRLLIGLSDFMAGYWWAALFAVIIGFLLFRVTVNSQGGRYRFDIFKLKIPVVGTLLRKVLVLRFITMLGILIEAGLPVVQALSIVATSMTNEIYRLKIYQVISRVQQGQSISSSLQDTPFLFPETVVQMLTVGEQSASLGLISNKIGKQYDIEIDNSLKRLTSLFEPIMIVFVGVSVALLALAVMIPIFNLSQIV